MKTLITGGTGLIGSHLTGDYKLNQPKDSKVQKTGVMEIPLLDDNIDKQAF